MSKIIIVEGVGINDLSLCGPHYYWNPEKNDSICTPEYKMWYEMIRRSYSEKLKDFTPSTKQSSCCVEWLHRYNFKLWYDSQKHYKDSSGKLLCLDKDILVLGNKEYGPKTCALVPQYINVVMRDISGEKKDSALPLWAYYQKPTQDMINEYNRPYFSKVVCNKKTFRGSSHKLPLDAHSEGQLLKAKSLEWIVNDIYQKESCFNEEVANSILKVCEKLRMENSMGIETKSLT